MGQCRELKFFLRGWNFSGGSASPHQNSNDLILSYYNFLTIATMYAKRMGLFRESADDGEDSDTEADTLKRSVFKNRWCFNSSGVVLVVQLVIQIIKR